jgi:hypothetical protein
MSQLTPQSPRAVFDEPVYSEREVLLPFATRIPAPLHRRLQTAKLQLGLPIGQIVARAVDAYLDERGL